MTDAPIACSLAPAEYRTRMDDTARVAQEALIERTATDGGVRMTFAGGDGMRERLERYVAAERECCPFLDLDLAEREDGRIVLEVTGPDEARPIITDLFRPG
jgi:hypothetical protein